jgi:hypothetical protein
MRTSPSVCGISSYRRVSLCVMMICMFIAVGVAGIVGLGVIIATYPELLSHR